MVAILLQVHAQNESMRQVYGHAESEFKIGHIEQAKKLLKESISIFTGNLKVSAYRLLSLCSLSLDETEEAEEYVLSGDYDEITQDSEEGEMEDPEVIDITRV